MEHTADFDAPGCECFVTPEHMWLSAASCGYGGGYEPGSQMEWNPDCPAHPGTRVIPGCVHCGQALPHEGTAWREVYRCRLFQRIAERAWDEGFNSDYEGDGWPPNPYRLAALTPDTEDER